MSPCLGGVFLASERGDILGNPGVLRLVKTGVFGEQLRADP